MAIVENFFALSVKNASFQKLKSDGTSDVGVKFGCLGTMECDTEVKNISRKCEGVEVEKVSKPIKMNTKLSAHIPVKILRDVFGFSSNGLKAGVYAYGTNSKSCSFIFTADVEDMYGTAQKHIALMNSSASNGFSWKLQNGAEEVAEVEMEIASLPDSLGNIYYEAFDAEVTDTDIKDKWHTEFTTDLVKV